MKIILCGYNWTGCKALSLLLDRGYELYVYTHKAQNCVADMERLCKKNSVSYSLERITTNNMPFKPDIICSIYYRYIIHKSVIDYVDGRIFNLHPSLLPKYRGCSSLTWAMINGEKECGYTYHYIDESCDTGDIILQKKIDIEDFDTQLTLYNRVMSESMSDFLKVLDLVIDGEKGHKQYGDESYYARGCPYNGIINDSMDEDMIERFIRAMIYPPYPSASYRDIPITTMEEYKKIKENR